MTQFDIEGIAAGRSLKIQHDSEKNRVSLKINAPEGSKSFTCRDDDFKAVITEMFPAPKKKPTEVPRTAPRDRMTG